MVERNEIARFVIALLEAVSHMGGISEQDDLRSDLLLTTLMLRALAPTYTRISESYGGLRITQAEAVSQRLVADSIDLVHARANG